MKTITIQGIEYTISEYPSNIIITAGNQQEPNSLYQTITCTGDEPITLSGVKCTSGIDLCCQINKWNLKKLLNRY